MLRLRLLINVRKFMYSTKHHVFTFFLKLFLGNFSGHCSHACMSPRRHDGGELSDRTFNHKRKRAQVKTSIATNSEIINRSFNYLINNFLSWQFAAKIYSYVHATKRARRTPCCYVTALVVMISAPTDFQNQSGKKSHDSIRVVLLVDACVLTV